MASEYRLAVAVKNTADEYLVVLQSPPANFQGEYEIYEDSDLWDLPSAPLVPLVNGPRSEVVVRGADVCYEKLDIGSFDIESALDEVQRLMGLVVTLGRDLQFFKYDEEAEFGPGPSVNTLVVLKLLDTEHGIFETSIRWISVNNATKLLCEAKPGDSRIGPIFALGLLHNVRKWEPPTTSQYQEYPPSIFLVPMISRTLKPFSRTNLVVIVSDNTVHALEELNYIASGNSLLVDPGCHSYFHKELEMLVATLPRKLLVFVTHHHNDHVEGLSVVQRCNPDAILIAHENTMSRIGKEKWSGCYIIVSGGETISVGDQKLDIVSAKGHTDGHLALLHVNTNSIIVGDHCVGQGSAILDINSGGNMKDYFETTYRFLELSPHVLIPMHGRFNVWPKRMLCGYLKHRRDRESSILKAIAGGANTLFDILSKSYADVDRKLWMSASFNVRLHVDHLASKGQLPEGFNLRKFRRSCGFNFIIKWGLVFLWRKKKATPGFFLVAAAVASLATTFIMKRLLR